MASELEKKIIHQIEYYFGDINLPRDKFMQGKLKEDEDGWIPLEVLLTFKRLASISDEPEVIASAVEKSDAKLVEVSEDRKKLRRSPKIPLPELNETRKRELSKRTAYAKGFPPDETLNDIIQFLEPYGLLETCIRRTIINDKIHIFKGSCFVIFKDIEDCKKFIEAESIKYKDTELVRKWQQDYYADKRKEVEAMKKEKKDKKLAKQQEQQEKEKPIEFPKGAILYFGGIEEGQSLTREEIKDKVKEVGEVEVSYIDFAKGDIEGHIRLSVENAAVEFFKKLTDGLLEIGDIKLKLRVLEGEEEEEHLKKTSEAVIKMRQKQKSNRFSRKRKGNFGGNHHSGKSRKVDSE